MRTARIATAALAVLAVLATGCASAVGGDAAADASSADIARDAAVPECTAVCEARERDAGAQGFCFNAADGGLAARCADYCNGGWPGWSDAQRTAFRTCAATDPLCFQTIEMCMASH